MAKTTKQPDRVRELAEILVRLDWWEGEIRRANASGRAHINLSPRIEPEERHIERAKDMLDG